MASFRRTGSASTWHAIAALRPEAWLPGRSSRSRTTPLVTPARVSAAATEAPAKPAPITTTSTSDGIRPRGAIPSVYGGSHRPAAGGVCVAEEDILAGPDIQAVRCRCNAEEGRLGGATDGPSADCCLERH